MKKIFILFFLISRILAHGQSDSTYYNRYLSINLTELIQISVRLSYEYRLNSRHSINFESGYKSRVLEYSPMNSISPFDGRYQMFQANPYSYNKFTASVGYNYFFDLSTENSEDYLSGILMYKQDFCKNTIIVDGTDGSYRYTMLSGFESFYEFKLLYATRILKLKNKNSISSFIELYSGLGISYRTGESYINLIGNGHDPTPTISQVPIDDSKWKKITNQKIGPRFYFGLKYGVAWKKN